MNKEHELAYRLSLLKRCHDFFEGNFSDTEFDMDATLSDLHAEIHNYLYDKGALR